MGADLHIHVVTDDMTEDDFKKFFANHLGSPFFAPRSIGEEREAYEPGTQHSFEQSWYKRIAYSPNVHVGEVSWLKAALFDDDSFIPEPVGAVQELIDWKFPVIDDEFIEKVKEALGIENTTSYDVESEDTVISFLRQHMGKTVFCISW